MNKLPLTLKPSQWTNAGWILFGLVGIMFVVPPLIAIYKIMETYCHRYDLYDNHILESTGVFTVTRNEINYFRVKSIQIEEPFLYRFVELHSIHIKTSDQYIKDFTIKAVPVDSTLVKNLRNLVRSERKVHNVREFDMYDL